MVVILAIVAVPVVRTKVPVTNGGADGRFLREFDWVGVILLSGMISSLLLYTSSRPVTGVAPLRDWRLGLLALVSSAQPVEAYKTSFWFLAAFGFLGVILGMKLDH